MPKPFFKISKSVIDQIIRVDHAGEFGAQRIYQGQLKYTKDESERQLIKHMLDQEQEHLQFFEEKIHSNRVRPTVLIPLWNIGGYFIGALGSLISPKTAMLITEKVEEVIENHYAEQINLLEQADPNNELITTLKKFRADEIDHKHIAIEHESRGSPFAPLLSLVVQNICKLAISLSKKI